VLCLVNVFFSAFPFQSHKAQKACKKEKHQLSWMVISLTAMCSLYLATAKYTALLLIWGKLPAFFSKKNMVYSSWRQ